MMLGLENSLFQQNDIGCSRYKTVPHVQRENNEEKAHRLNKVSGKRDKGDKWQTLCLLWRHGNQFTGA